MALKEESLSYAVIGCAMQVHRDLGPGVDEAFYHALLCERLRAIGVEHISKPRMQLIHRGVPAATFEPDIVLPGRLILELKRLWGGFTPEHYVQLKGYLKFTKIPHGLLLDFGKERLFQKRFVFVDQLPCPTDAEALLAQAPPAIQASAQGAQLCCAVARVASQHGLGYRDSTYRGLLQADLSADRLHCVSHPTALVRSSWTVLGETALPCLSLEETYLVMPLSQRDAIRAADVAIMRSWMRHTNRPHGAIVSFGKRDTRIHWITSGTSTPDSWSSGEV